MTIEERMDRLEIQMKNLQDSFLQMSKNQVPITAKTDNASNKIPQVDENTIGVSDNSLGLFDVAALADENSQAIMDLAELIAEKDGE